MVGVGLTITLIFLAMIFALWQMVLLRQAFRDLQEEESRLTFTLDAAQQVTDLIVIVQQGAGEQNLDRFSQEVNAAIGALEGKRDKLTQQRAALPERDPIRIRAGQVINSIDGVIDLANEAIEYARVGDWSRVDIDVALLLSKYGDVRWSVDQMVTQARDNRAQADARADQAMQRMIFNSAPLVGVALMVAITVTFLVVRSVTRGMEQLSASARQLAEGRFDERISLARQDELGQLAGSFNAMAEQLQSLYTSLEQQVTEQTARLARRSVQLEAAALVAREAAAIREVGQLLKETAYLISDRFGFYHAGVFLLDERGEYAVLQAASSEGGQRMLARGHKLKVGEVGIVGYAAAAGQSRIALDAGEDAVYFDSPDLPDTRSELALPLKVRERVIGVLDVQSVEARAFTEEDVAILQLLADQVALAVNNARLFEETQERLRETDLLLRRYGRGEWARLATERSGWGYVYDGVDVVPRDQARAAREEPNLVMPLQVRDEAIGRLGLSLADRSLTPAEIDLIREVAGQAGLALENARLFLETQRTLGEVEALYRAGRAIGSATSADQVAQALVDYATPSEVDTARILFFEHDERGQPTYLIVSEGWRTDGQPAQPSGTRLLLADYPLADLMSANEPIVVQDVFAEPRANQATRNLMTLLDLRSFAIVPITVGERWMGVVFLGRSESFGFSEELIRGCQTLAGQAAVALESLRLLQETELRAERERLVGEVTTRVRQTLDVDAVLQSAVHELGQALGLAEVVIQLASDGQPIGNSMLHDVSAEGEGREGGGRS